MYLLQHVRRNRTKSLPNSPTLPIPQYSEDGIKTSSLLSQKIPPLIPEIDLSRRPPPFQSQSQDDSRIGTWSGLTPIDLPLRRVGSWESGFFSSSNTDWLSEEGLLSSRSIASSLLTVSDLEVEMITGSKRDMESIYSKQKFHSVPKFCQFFD